MARRGGGPPSSLTGLTPTRCPTGIIPSGSWQCRSCPFLDICLPGAEAGSTEAMRPEAEEEDVSDEEARDAVAGSTRKLRRSIKEPEKAKRAALKTLKEWMRRHGDAKVTIGDRKVSLVASKRYSVNYRKLNELLDPEVRAEVVTESESEYVRVS